MLYALFFCFGFFPTQQKIHILKILKVCYTPISVITGDGYNI